MKIVITGASGFIGGHLTRKLARDGHHVVCAVRKNSRLKHLEGLPVTFVTVDFSDKASFYPAVRNAHWLFHLAAAVHHQDWQYSYKINALGTRILLEALFEKNPQLGKFVFVSSIAAAGPSAKDHPRVEEDPNEPISLYGRSKLAAEEFVAEFSDRIPATIVRPTHVLGCGQGELFLLLSLMRRGVVPVLGTRFKQTSICFVEDLIQALLLAAEKEQSNGRTYFVSDNEAYSWQGLLGAMMRHLPVRGVPLYLPYNLIATAALLSKASSRVFGLPELLPLEHIRSTRKNYFLYSSDRIINELGFCPAVSLDDGIAAIIGWYKERGLL